MSSVVARSPSPAPNRALQLAHTILCLGLNLAISKIRSSRYAGYVVALLVLNEIRGLYVVYTAADQALPWLS